MHQSAFTSSPGGYHTWLHHKLEDNGKPAGGRPQPGQELTYAQTDKTENILPQAPSIGQAHTHTRLMALCPGLPRWASTRKVKPIWILLKQETVVSAGTYASLHLAPDRLPRQHPTTQFNTGWMPFLPIYWIGIGIKTTANQVLTITEAQEHCCCNSWQVCTGRHENILRLTAVWDIATTYCITFQQKSAQWTTTKAACDRQRDYWSGLDEATCCRQTGSAFTSTSWTTGSSRWKPSCIHVLLALASR